MPDLPKPLVLLDAYEELTQKETFCIREVNLVGLADVQEKKAKLLAELQRLSAETKLSPPHKRALDGRVEILLKQENENAESLASIMKENREAYKLVSQTAASAGHLRKAYGAEGANSARRNLTSEA